MHAPFPQWSSQSSAENGGAGFPDGGMNFQLSIHDFIQVPKLLAGTFEHPNKNPYFVTEFQKSLLTRHE
jgi:hypothetical protein